MLLCMLYTIQHEVRIQTCSMMIIDQNTNDTWVFELVISLMTSFFSQNRHLLQSFLTHACVTGAHTSSETIINVAHASCSSSVSSEK